jgi:hypothetical protein
MSKFKYSFANWPCAKSKSLIYSRYFYNCTNYANIRAKGEKPHKKMRQLNNIHRIRMSEVKNRRIKRRVFDTLMEYKLQLRYWVLSVHHTEPGQNV